MNGTFNPAKWDYSDPATYGGMIIGGFAGYAGAAIGASVGTSAIAGGATTVEAGIAGGMMGGMTAGAINGAGMTALAGGGFGDIMGGMTQGAVMGGFAGAASGGIGAWIGDFSGVTGSGFKNAMYELGHSALKGGAQGLAGGSMMAAMNQDASYMWKGAAFGAGFGAGMAGLRIGLMGPTFLPDENYYCEIEDFGQIHRKGGLLRAVTLGRNAVGIESRSGKYSFDKIREVRHHESYHVKQINEMGAARFYSKWVAQGLKFLSSFGNWNGTYVGTINGVPTIENAAMRYTYDRLGYWMNGSDINYKTPFWY